MATIKIGAPNYLEVGWATLGGGLWANSLANLLDPDFGNPVISVGTVTTSTRFTIDLSLVAAIMGTTPGSEAFMIPKSNLTQSATIRVRGGSAAFNDDGTGGGTVAYDSTAIAPFPTVVYPPGYTSIFGRNAISSFHPLMDSAFNQAITILFPARVYATYWHVQISDTTNPAGYVSLARAMLAPLYQPSINPQFGLVLELGGNRAAGTSSTNAEFPDPGRKLKRVITMSFADIPMDESLTYFFRLMAFLGYAKQAMFILDPDATYHKEITTFAVTQLRPGGIAYRYSDRNEVPLQLQEVI